MKYLKQLFSAYVSRVQACWAEYGEQDSFTAQAAAALVKYTAVRLTGAGPTVNIASHNLAGMSAMVGIAVGVVQNDPASGQAATIARSGLSKAVTGASVTVLDLVTHDASGYIITAVSGSNVIGRALEASGGALQTITVLLQYPVKFANG